MDLQIDQATYEKLDDEKKAEYAEYRPRQAKDDEPSVYRLAPLVEGAWQNGDETSGLLNALKRERATKDTLEKTAARQKATIDDLTGGLADELNSGLETYKADAIEAKKEAHAIRHELEVYKTAYNLGVSLETDDQGRPNAALADLQTRSVLGPDGKLRIIADDGNLALDDQGNPLRPADYVRAIKLNLQKGDPRGDHIRGTTQSGNGGLSEPGPGRNVGLNGGTGQSVKAQIRNGRDPKTLTDRERVDLQNEVGKSEYLDIVTG